MTQAHIVLDMCLNDLSRYSGQGLDPKNWTILTRHL